MWSKLAAEWRVEQLDNIASEITLDEVPRRVQEILSGHVVGRTLVAPEATI
jgi:hypothetical protein